jgi:hypothetical protein
MCKALKSLMLVFSLILFSIASASAQATTAGVTGRVVDGQGNVVPGAKVTAKNRATGAERTAIASSDGEYTLTDLAPGRYDISAEAPSFSRALVEDFELNVNARPTVNFDLKPGNVTETVTVTMDQPLVETTKSDIGTTVTPNEIQNLPLLNRTFAGLTVIAPEARPVGTFDPTKTRVGTVAFNGGDGRGVNVNVDGGDNKDNVVGSLLQNFSYESIQEFRVQQHRWTAEQGRAVGGIVDVISKSGGNEFHGSLFSNFRHDKIQRRDFFDKLQNRDNPKFERQEFGGSLGGPIPTFGFGEDTPFKLLRDKAFFFVALERFRERQNVAMAADAQAQFQLIPAAFGLTFDPIIPTPYDDTMLTAKIDIKASERQNMFFRYSWQDNKSPNDQVANPHRTNLSGGNVTTNGLHSFLFNHSYNLSSNVLNTFVFHFQDFKNEILPTVRGLAINFPNITIGQNANTPQATLERKYQFRDDVSVVTGDHSFKFGANYIHTILDGYFYFGVQGFNVTYRQTPEQIIAGGGFNRPDLLQSVTFSDGASSHYQVIDQVAFYVQDDWKIHPRLTLNLGLRWDANIGNLPAQDENRTLLLLSQLNHPVARALTGDPAKLTRTTPSYKEFQPRVGFAWDPFGDSKTVIRGGYGIFYDQIFQNLSLFSATQAQPFVFQPSVNLTRPCPAADPVCPAPPLPPGGYPLFNVIFNGTTTSLPQPDPTFTYSSLAPGTRGFINDPDAKEAFIQKWSIGFQREFGSNWSLSSDYVHTLGLDEPRFLNINPEIDRTCDPLFPGALQTTNPAYATTCPRGSGTRLLDPAFIAAGLGAGRLNEIRMFATNNRSLFDSWTTTLKYKTSRMLLNAAYVLASSRAWGGQPTASYSGTGIFIRPEDQFKEEEFGPTRLDERHRIVISGVLNLPWGLQLSPILQYATARPYSPITGLDVDGDGLSAIDRLCQGVSPAAVFAVRGNATAIRALNPRGCTQVGVNSQRSGFVPDGAGGFEERSGRFFNVDVRATKTFRFGERYALSTYLDLYNVFNTENLSFMTRIGLSAAATTSAATTGSFLTPQSLFGPGFGPPVGRPLTAQLGARFTF